LALASPGNALKSVAHAFRVVFYVLVVIIFTLSIMGAGIHLAFHGVEVSSDASTWWGVWWGVLYTGAGLALVVSIVKLGD
jgi:hypothetical protein